MKFIRCDGCTLEASEHEAQVGWVSIDTGNYVPAFVAGHWHFCSWACVAKFAQERVPGKVD